MIHKQKISQPDQRLTIESLLGRSIGENEDIIILTTDAPSAPEWLETILGECARARFGPTFFGRN
jgi:hypothetical protein